MSLIRPTTGVAPFLGSTMLAVSSTWAQQVPMAAPETPPVTIQPAATGVPTVAQERSDPSTKTSATQNAQSTSSTAPAREAIVSVTATKLSNRIDRQVYDVKSDPATSNDTVSDTLNKVPSLAVDQDGNVTLRGRSNVQILIDGKPSAMMQGSSRGVVLNALPASDVESVEVINNPGAQFGNEGGGGPIVNLVMRRERTPGSVGTLNANVGSSDRYNTSGFGSYTTGSMSVQGSVFHRRDGRDTSGETVRDQISPSTGGLARNTEYANGASKNDASGFNATMSYTLSPQDALGLGIGYIRSKGDNDSRELYQSLATSQELDSDYARSTASDNRNRNFNLNARLDHKGSLPGETFKLDLRLSGTDADGDTNYASRYTVRPPGAVDSLGRQDNGNTLRLFDFTGDYERPLGSGRLSLGYKLARTRSNIGSQYFDTDPATLFDVLNTSRTNMFDLDDTVAAAYGSYQLRIDSKWSALGGVRAEYDVLDMDQVTTGVHARNRSTSLIPSAIVSYGWSDDTTLHLSYAHRIRRPNASELNPFVIYRDDLNVSSGNPDLKPSRSDSIEFGIETKLGAIETNLRFYARRDTDLIAERRYLLDNDVLLTTLENAGSSNSGGIEFTLSGHATQKLTINASGNVGYSQQTILGMQNSDIGKRSPVTLTGRVRMSYQMDPKDQFQLVLNAQGKQLSAQGYRKPSQSADFSYRHGLSPALSFVLNVRDLFNSQKIETITETDTLRETSIRRFNGRTVFAGLSYRFGSFGQPTQRPGRSNGGAGSGG